MAHPWQGSTAGVEGSGGGTTYALVRMSMTEDRDSLDCSAESVASMGMMHADCDSASFLARKSRMNAEVIRLS